MSSKKLRTNKNFTKKNVRKLRNKKKSKKGGNSARSTTLCMYSPNMDNGANGVYGFHPVWGQNCCNGETYQAQNIDIISKNGVLGGKPFSDSKAGRRKKNKRSKKNTQKGGKPDEIQVPDNLKKAFESLNAALEDEQQNVPAYKGDGDSSSSGSSPGSQVQEGDSSSSGSAPRSQVQEDETSSSVSASGSQVQEGETSSSVSAPGSQGYDDGEDDSDDDEDGEDSKNSGGKRKKTNKKKRKLKRKSRKFRMNGGNSFANINDGFKCLVSPWNNNSWTNNYNPLAVSNYPVAPSKTLPHSNKYSWNQEG